MAAVVRRTSGRRCMMDDCSFTTQARVVLQIAKFELFFSSRPLNILAVSTGKKVGTFCPKYGFLWLLKIIENFLARSQVELRKGVPSQTKKNNENSNMTRQFLLLLAAIVMTIASASCDTDKDCPSSYCQNDPSKAPPYT